jgi:hypothetical protein
LISGISEMILSTDALQTGIAESKVRPPIAPHPRQGHMNAEMIRHCQPSRHPPRRRAHGSELPERQSVSRDIPEMGARRANSVEGRVTFQAAEDYAAGSAHRRGARALATTSVVKISAPSRLRFVGEHVI